MRYTINDQAYNTRGIKSEGFGSKISSWSSDLFESIVSDNDFDPISKKEELIEEEKRKIISESIKKILFTIIGEQNFTKYYLYRIEKIESRKIAEYFNLNESAIRKSCMVTERKIEEFVKSMNSYESSIDKILTISQEIKQKDRSDKEIKLKDAIQLQFNFEESIKEYEKNLRKFK